LLVPAFLEGGRTTVAGVHRLDGRPVHETAFGRDRLFGYGSSYLPQWVEEKTGGRVAADQVQRLDLELMEAAALAWEQGGVPAWSDWRAASPPWLAGWWWPWMPSGPAS
jgi:uncharacterized protein YgbK (DUF1537 family)